MSIINVFRFYYPSFYFQKCAFDNFTLNWVVKAGNYEHSFWTKVKVMTLFKVNSTQWTTEQIITGLKNNRVKLWFDDMLKKNSISKDCFRKKLDEAKKSHFSIWWNFVFSINFLCLGSTPSVAPRWKSER